MMRRLLLVVLVISLALPMLASAAPLAVPAAQSCGPGVVHVVSYGENVFRISLRYGTTVGAIVSANGLANPNVIYAGQSLLIPCASGSVPAPYPTTPPMPAYVATPIFINLPGAAPVQVTVPSNGAVVVPAPVSAVNCFYLRPTSPLDGFGNGTTVFYWDGAPGAQSYRVNVFNLDHANGAVVATYATSGPFTRVAGDTTISAIGEGFRFAWNVEAVADGRTVCSSWLAFLYRSAP